MEKASIAYLYYEIQDMSEAANARMDAVLRIQLKLKLRNQCVVVGRVVANHAEYLQSENQ